MGLYIILSTILLRPILSFLFQIFNFVPYVKARLTFERKNLRDDLSDYRAHIKGKNRDDGIAFFVSSEGEFEQVFPVIEVALEKDLWIEIIYTSPSVEKKVISFVELQKNQNKKKIFALRLPLMSFFPVDFFIFQSPLSWVKSKTVVFCRYDFFPELLFFKYLNRRLVLVSATLKNKNPSGFRGLYLKSFYQLFSVIIPATIKDQELISTISQSKKCQAPFDFRVSRILSRLEKSAENFRERFGLENFYYEMSEWKKKRGHESLILGSLWPSDLPIVLSKEAVAFYAQNEWSLFIYPHKLSDDEFIYAVKKLIEEKGQGLEFKLIMKLSDLKELKEIKKGTVYYMNVGGLLVESYQFFEMAYVGGGFERSIHSVLEPYIAQNTVITGVKTHRSTEWELINQDEERTGGISVGSSGEFLNALRVIIQSKTSIGGSKNYQSLIQWNKERINDLVKNYFI